METIAHILGGTQLLLGIRFEIQECFETYLSEEMRTFLAILRVVEGSKNIAERVPSWTGRKAFFDTPFRRSFLAKSFLRIETNSELRKRLLSDSNLRQICGFTRVPSESTFSRRMAEESHKCSMEQLLNAVVKEYHKDTLVMHISRDSTAIEAREKAVNKKSEVTPVTEKKRRGRPCKGEKRAKKEETKLKKQLRQKAGKSLSELNIDCAWSAKKNSQGNMSYWRGYKLHLDISDYGIPITAVVTGANVHDSQLAIPMEKITEKRVTHLYSLMDAAYDAHPIFSYVTGKGRVALIDANKRRGVELPRFDPAQKERFKKRTVAERANAHLKDYLVPARLFVKGIKKVTFALMCAVVCLAAVKILQYFILPKLSSSI